MRKTTLAILLFFIVNISFAQNWLDIGLKGGYGTSILMNGNIWSDGLYNHKITGVGNFGAKVGFNFDATHEITADVMFNKFHQEFKYDIELASATDSTVLITEAHNSSLSYKSVDLIFMYRHNNDGRYSEIGPVISLLQTASRSDDLQGSTVGNIKQYLNPSIMGISGGFGTYIMGTENFGITAGARLTYMFSDLVSSDGKILNMPTEKEYSSYKGSFPLFVQIIFEANLDFAYLSKAQCGRRKLMTF